MTVNKKQIIIVIDDKAKEEYVRNNIKNLAGKLNFNTDEIASQVKVITIANQAYELIDKAKNDKQDIVFAFVDDHMNDGCHGVKFAEKIRKNNPDSAVAWISSNGIEDVFKNYLQKNGLFNGDDKLMFPDDKLSSGVLKHILLNKDLSIFVGGDSHISKVVIPALEKAFQQITPKKIISPSNDVSIVTNNPDIEKNNNKNLG